MSPFAAPALNPDGLATAKGRDIRVGINCPVKTAGLLLTRLESTESLDEGFWGFGCLFI